MPKLAKKLSLEEFQKVPGVGGKIAAGLWAVGIRSLGQLKEEDPEKLYDRLCKLRKGKVDRCVLYVFRTAVYFASTKKPRKSLLKWWNWKD